MTGAGDDLAVLTRLVEVAGRDVVDVGCGRGSLARALQRAGARVLGVEIDEARVRAAREAEAASPVRFAVGRGEALPLPDAGQDVVVYMRSLHHVPVPAMDAALREARRVLRSGGALHVVEPLPEGDFYEMVALVEDEGEVRAAAQAALGRAGAMGLDTVAVERYETAATFADLDAVRARIVGVDPARGPVFDARRGQLQARFDAGGTPVGAAGREYRSAHRAAVLRAS